MHVLWIDDHPDDATVRLLLDEGVAVEVASTAAEGLEKTAMQTFDVILLDVNLPDMYGMTVLRRLRSMGLHGPIVVATGCYFEPEVEVEAGQLGAS